MSENRRSQGGDCFDSHCTCTHNQLKPLLAEGLPKCHAHFTCYC